MPIENPDYSKYLERLQSYDDPNWDSQVYIKDLVEAGFVYSGTQDQVFCFKCGKIARDWKEDEDPLTRHQALNKSCPYLNDRARRLSTSSSYDSGQFNIHSSSGSSYKSPFDFEQQSALYYWVPGKGPVRHECLNGNLSETNHVTHSALQCNVQRMNGTLSGEVRSSRVTSLANPDMRYEKRRFESFAVCPINKHWPLPELLSSAGFYYVMEPAEMRCFCCGVRVEGWESSEQDPLRKHRAASPGCDFVLGTYCGNVRSDDDDLIEEQNLFVKLNISPSKFTEKNDIQTIEEIQPNERYNHAYFTYQESSTTTTTTTHQTNKPYVANVNSGQFYNKNNSYHQNNVNHIFPQDHKQPRAINDPNFIPSCTMPNVINTSGHKTYTRNQPSHSNDSYGKFVHGSIINSPTAQQNGFSTTMPIHTSLNSSLNNSFTVVKSIDFTDIAKRLETFLTWPRTAFLQPKELADAGFLYIGKGDGVTCYKCKVLLKQWEQGDTAWTEHERWSPVCPLVIERIREVNHQRQISNPRTPTKSGGHRKGSNLDDYMQHLRCQNQMNSKSTTEIKHQSVESCQSLPLSDSSEKIEELPQRYSSYGDLPKSTQFDPYKYMNTYRQSPNENISELVRSNRQLTHSNFQREHSSHNSQEQYICDYSSNSSLQQRYLPSSSRHESTGSDKISLRREDLQELLSMGFSEEVIQNTINCYREYARRSFSSLNDLAQAVLYFQEHGNLEGTPYGQNLNVQPTVGGENMIYKPPQRPNPPGNNQKNDDMSEEHHKCKVCFDNDVEVTFLPCGHLIVCESCALGMKICPICREEINGTIRTFYFGN